jgi:hypothetical protein
VPGHIEADGRDAEVERLAATLGSETYVLAPSDGRYFFGAEVMAGVAVGLLTTFMKGLLSGVRGELESWGETSGGWLARRVAGLVKAEVTPAEATEELDADTHDAAEAGAAEYRDAVVVALGHVLRRQGMTETEAAETAERVAHAADALLDAAR